MSKRNQKVAFLLLSTIIFFILIVGLASHFLTPLPGRTNFLVLGIAGSEYPGEDLTDSLFFVSVDNRSAKTLLISLPRDIWLAQWRTKLNSIYHYRGLTETKNSVSQILGQPIDYGLIINFNLFTQIVDILNGVEVEVERTFDDYWYPIAGKEKDPCDNDPQFRCRYQHVRFEAGKQLMDGETALKYARSRQAEGEEGTDFARSRRQQNLISAIKDKILSPQFFLTPGKVLQLTKVVMANIQTDISSEEYFELLKIALRFRSESLKMETLNNNFLITPTNAREKYDGHWTLIPKTGNWEEVHQNVNSLLESF